MDTNNLQIQIKTLFGLEKILAEEVKKLGGRNVEIRNRAVNCEGDLGFLYKINYSLRTALKILVPIHEFKAFNEYKFYHKLSQINWDDYLGLHQSFSIDATVYSEKFTHSRYMSLKMKDAIVDYFRKKYNKRPNIDTKNPDIAFHLHIDRDWVTVSLNSSGEPLFKRGYRQNQVKAPINEVLASGMLQMAGWDGKGNFLDPMCGSGTLLIEAAMLAMNLPAQLFRKKFAFQNWRNYDEDLFTKIKEFRLNKIKEFSGKIIGYDKDALAVSIARENVAFTELDEVIEIHKKDFFETKKEHFPLLIMFNPPYDERLEINDEAFYKKIGDTFKQNYPNTLAWLISADLSAVKRIGLRPSKKIKLYNGKLETKFLQYEMYEGTKKTKG
ncbi:MAG: RNA methyltransferase [Flavobacteriales bacterium]|nr:MAG: RNA methyltransferase [Flavobacteriales bacterium]